MSEKMSFEEQHVHYTSYSEPKGMVGFLIKKCGVQDEQMANMILVGVALVIFVLAGLVFYSALH